MANRKSDNVHPWHQIEEQAFHAFREWPLWLVLRQRELQRQAHLARQSHGAAAGQSRPADAGSKAAKSKGN